MPRINCFDKVKNKNLLALKAQFEQLVPIDTDLSENEQKEIGKKLTLEYYSKLKTDLDKLKHEIDPKLYKAGTLEYANKEDNRIGEQVAKIESEYSELINKELQNETRQQPRSTEAIATSTAAIINKAEAAQKEEEIDASLDEIEAQLTEIESKVGKLTENWPSADIANEYPNRVIGKKAKKEITKYAKEIARINGWEITKDRFGVYDNIAPAGGEVIFRFDIPGTPYLMYVSAKYEPNDNLEYVFNGFFYRLEEPAAKGQAKYKGVNQWQHDNVTAKEMAEILKSEYEKYAEKKKDLSGLTKSRTYVIPTTDEKAQVKAFVGKRIMIGDNYEGFITFTSGPENGIYQLHDSKGNTINVHFFHGQLLTAPGELTGGVFQENTPVTTYAPKEQSVTVEQPQGEINGLTADEAIYLVVRKGIKPQFRERYLKDIGLYNNAKENAILEKLKSLGAFSQVGNNYGITSAGKDLARKMESVVPDLKTILNTYKQRETYEKIKGAFNQTNEPPKRKYDQDIDAAANDFFNEDQQPYGAQKQIDAEKIKKGMKLIGLYLEAGTYKFPAIIQDLHNRYGDKVREFFDALKTVYGGYYNAQATEEQANQMDANLRSFTFDNIINSTEYDGRSTNVVKPSVDNTTEGVVERPAQPNVPADGTRGNTGPVGSTQSTDSDKTEGRAGGQASADQPSRGTGEGRSDVAINGNEELNHELGGETEEQPIPTPVQAKPVVSELQHNGNFLIPLDFVNSKTFNVAQKLQDNIDAIRVLIGLRNENRKATYEEQKALFKYVGWGGIKEIGFDPKSGFGWSISNVALKPKIQEALDVLRELDEENFAANLAAIKSSTLNAHYTAIPVIRGVYDILKNAGFNGGNIVEPSAGVGHFVGAMPMDILENSKITAVEKDNITGHILKGLYPNINTKISGFENVSVAPGSVDLMISNIPFGTFGVFDEAFSKNKELQKFQKPIHSYFFARAIQDVKDNGIISFITSTGVLDSPSNREIRNLMRTQTEFLGAIRLPNNAFVGNANTQVTTDIIFLRKLTAEEKANGFKQNHDFLDLVQKELTHKNSDQVFKVAYNEYFDKNPSHVLGEIKAFSMYSSSATSDDITVVPTPGMDIEKAIANLGTQIFTNKIQQAQQKKKVKEVDESLQHYVKNIGQRSGNLVEVSPGVYGIYTDALAIDPELDEKARLAGVNPDKIREGDLYSDDYEKLEAAGLKASDFEINQTAEVKIPKKYQKAVPDLIALRDTLNKLYAAEYGDDAPAKIEALRQDLNLKYSKFVKNNGTLYQNKALLDLDIDGYNLGALENVEDKKVKSLADIFKKRIFQKAQRAETAADIHDAIAINLNETGSIDLDRLAELLKKTPEEIIAEGKDIIYKNPVTGNFETKEKYLSGNVRRKLIDARLAAQTDTFYEENVAALERAQPTDLMASQIYAPISAPWIDTKYLTEFASHIFKQNVKIARLSSGRVAVSIQHHNTEIDDIYGTKRMDGAELLAEAIQNRTPLVKDLIKGPPDRQVVNEQATKEATDKANKIRAEFDNWIWQDDNRRTDLVNYYNQNFNNTVLRKYDGSKLTFPGYAGLHTPKPHQLDGAWMIIQNMGGIIDHIVGAGKTLLFTLATYKMKQMGLIKKPILIGLKANTADLAKEFRTSFPIAKVLSPTEKDFTPERRRAFFAKMANNDWDAIVMTHDQFGMIEQSNEIQQELIQEELENIERDTKAAKQQNMSKRDLRNLEIRKENLLNRLRQLQLMPKDPSIKTFEEMGVDFLLTDESQQFKNLAYSTIQRGIAGLGDPQGSKKAFNMLVAIRTLQKMYGDDKGTAFASGTPISNTMVEMYSLFKYLRPNKLAEMGINSFDQWANTFAKVGSEIEFGVTNSLKPKVRMREFMNVPEMSMMYREIADVRNDSNLSLEKPKPKQTIRVKADKEILAGNQVSIEGNKFKVIGRIKGIEKNEYWLSLMSLGNDDWIIPSAGIIDFNGAKVNYSESERTDGLLVNVAPTLEQRKFAKKIQKFAETKDGAYIGRVLSDQDKKAYMLLATNLASKMAIDMRLINPSYASTEVGKLGVAADYITDHYRDSDKLKGVQLVFSDLGTPKVPSTAPNLFDLLESRGVDREYLEKIFGSGAYADKQTFPPLKKLRENIIKHLEYTENEFEQAVKEANEDNFNVYQELKDKLVARGIPSDEIAFIHDYKSDRARSELFEAAKSGRIRVIIGSTSKLGTGVNIQAKVVALHHLDVPWRPSDMEQRNGRGMRQGNFIIRDHYNNLIPIYYYATESTLDAYKYQLLDAKQKFINQAKTGETREISEGEGDEENGVSFAAMTAMLSGNPVLLEIAKINKKVKDLLGSKKSFEQDKYNLKDKIARNQTAMQNLSALQSKLEKDKNLFESNSTKDEKTGEWNYKATIAGQEFTERKAAGEKLLEERKKFISEYVQQYPETLKLKKDESYKLKENDKTIGNIAGFDIVIRMRGAEGEKNLILSPEIGVVSPNTNLPYKFSASGDPVSLAGSLQREIRELGSEMADAQRREKVYQADTKEKETYLNSLPEAFPKQAELDAAVETQIRLQERLDELAKSKPIPSKDELEALGTPEEFPNEFELENLYAITPDGTVIPITSDQDLSNALGLTDVGHFGHMVGLAKQDGFRFYNYVDEFADMGIPTIKDLQESGQYERIGPTTARETIIDKDYNDYTEIFAIMNGADVKKITNIDEFENAEKVRPVYYGKMANDQAEFSVTGPYSPDIEEMEAVLKEQIEDFGVTKLSELQNIIANELDDHSEEMRDLVEQAYHEYGRGISTPSEIVESVIDRVANNLSAFQGDEVVILPNTTELLKKAAEFDDNQFQVNEGQLKLFSQGEEQPYVAKTDKPYKAPKEDGSIETVQAIWTESKHIPFNGTAKVKSHTDVAHIMRLLEDKLVEHAFVIHVDKNGDSHIQLVGIGGITGAVFDPRLVLAGINKFKSKKIYMVHNHPSGNLVPSVADIQLTKKAASLAKELGVQAEHVIMNTLSGEYTVLDEMGGFDTPIQFAREKTKTDAQSLPTHHLDMAKTLREPLVNKITSSEDAAQFIQTIQFGAQPKRGVLVLNQNNAIVSNYILPKYTAKAILQKMQGIGTAVIFYGNTKDDIREVNSITPKLAAADIKVLDHIVVAPGSSVRQQYISAMEEGLLHEVQAEYGTNLLKEGVENMPDVVNGFYSPLEKIINETKYDKLPATQWLSKFGTGEEAKWTGLTDWLKQQTGSVTKEQIQQFLRDNRIQITEVTKSENDVNVEHEKLKAEAARATERLTAISRELGGTGRVPFLSGSELTWHFKDAKNNENKQVPEKYHEEIDKLNEAIIALEDYESDAEAGMDEPMGRGATQYATYQLPGEKTDYKEVLITLPSTAKHIDDRRITLKKINPTQADVDNFRKRYAVYIDDILVNNVTGVSELDAKNNFKENYLSQWQRKNDFVSNHWNEHNIVAHLRMNTRVDAEGKKVLFLEEIQSDWGEIWRKEGYTIGTPEMPAAPFITDTNAWTKLALKVALKEAVKQGADKIAWTTGEQQAKRYSLRQQVDEIRVDKVPDYKKTNGGGEDYYKQVEIFPIGQYSTTLLYVTKDGVIVEGPSSLFGKNLRDVVGKEMAEKIMNSKPGFTQFTGLDLEVGGEGMEGYYGNPSKNKLGIVGNVAKSLFKQEPKTIGFADGVFGGEIKKTSYKEDGSISSAKPFKVEWVENGKTLSEKFETENEAKKFLKKVEDGRSIQHSIEITPELRAQVSTGQPMFMRSPEGKVLGFKQTTKLSNEGLLKKLIQKGVIEKRC